MEAVEKAGGGRRILLFSTTLCGLNDKFWRILRRNKALQHEVISLDTRLFYIRNWFIRN